MLSYGSSTLIRDLKSCGQQCPCGFDPRLGYSTNSLAKRTFERSQNRVSRTAHHACCHAWGLFDV